MLMLRINLDAGTISESSELKASRHLAAAAILQRYAALSGTAIGQTQVDLEQASECRYNMEVNVNNGRKGPRVSKESQLKLPATLQHVFTRRPSILPLISIFEVLLL